MKFKLSVTIILGIVFLISFAVQGSVQSWFVSTAESGHVTFKTKDYFFTDEGLVLWLDASIMNLGDETRVHQWIDRSGNKNHGVQNTEDFQPLYRKNVVNGLPVIDFTGGARFLNIPKDIARGVPGFSVFVVLQTNAIDSRQDILALSTGQTTGEVRVWYGREWEDGKISWGGRVLDADPFRQVSGGNVIPGQWSIDSAVFDFTETKLDIYRDGIHLGGLDPYQNSDKTSETDSILAQIGANEHFSDKVPMDGQIAEIIIFNRALSEDERKAVESYLASKYNLNP